jgi:glycosyltransferase involved in cell wall biosynthesis
MHSPKVSVLIPSYNYAHYIEEAIESVLSQTYQNFELIIVDNCSTDNTKEVVEQYIQKDSRIKLVINDVNIGMYRNYNKALLLANGEYIKFLNADDKLNEKCLEIFVGILDTNQDVSVVTSYRQFFGTKDDILKPKWFGLIDREKAILEALKHSNWIGEPTTVMFRRQNLYLGLFDVSIVFFADMDMWLRQLECGNLYVHNEVLSYFRIHEEQGTKYLNANINKALFNSLQQSVYLVDSLIFNRFGIDIFEKYPNDYKKIIAKNYKKTSKNIWKSKYWKERFFFINPISIFLGYLEGFVKIITGHYKWH